MKKILSISLLALMVLALPIALVGCGKKENKTAEKVSAKTFFDTEWVCTEITSDDYTAEELYSMLSFNFVDETGIIHDCGYIFSDVKENGRYKGKVYSIDHENFDPINWELNKDGTISIFSGYKYKDQLTLRYENNKLYEIYKGSHNEVDFECTFVYTKQ